MAASRCQRRRRGGEPRPSIEGGRRGDSVLEVPGPWVAPEDERRGVDGEASSAEDGGGSTGAR
jgi:hypothetical protein